MALYKDEVLGRRVAIEFVLDEEEETDFYEGTIMKMEMKLDKRTKGISIRHYVEFDDGDKKWFDLVKEEKTEGLRWVDMESSATASTSASPVAKLKWEEYNDETTTTGIKSEDATDTAAPPAKKVKREDDEKPAATLTVSPSPAHNDKKKATTTDALEETRGEESGGGWAGYDLPNPTSSRWPTSIDGIIRLMDELDPESCYYERQADSRGGCSGMRGKIRKYANKVKQEQQEDPSTPKNIAVQQWIDTGNWRPPNEASLMALMELIQKSMPKKK